MGAGLWPTRAALGARGWLCAGLWHWRWLGRHLGGMVVVMTQDEIIEMAKQAGWSVWFNDDGELQFLEAFAKLVAQHERSWEKFCDSHCVWTDHHPDCKLAKNEPDHSDELTIAYMSGLHRGKEVAQRTWVGLTDEEIDKAWRSVDYTVPWDQHRIDIARAIEAKLKEKNT